VVRFVQQTLFIASLYIVILVLLICTRIIVAIIVCVV